MSELTPKQERFVEEYLVDLNATAAARRAGYSERTADRIGPELLGKTWVAEAIREKQKAISEKTLVTVADVIKGLVKEANYTGEGASHSARVQAWAHLGKHLGILTDRLKVEGGLTIQTLVGPSMPEILGVQRNGHVPTEHQI